MERDLEIAATNISRDKRSSMIKLLEDQNEKDDLASREAGDASATRWPRRPPWSRGRWVCLGAPLGY